MPRDRVSGGVVGDGSPTGTYSAADLAQAAKECAVMTALVLIREAGDTDAALDLCAEFSKPVEGDEVLDAAGVAATAIREALTMGVTARG